MKWHEDRERDLYVGVSKNQNEERYGSKDAWEVVHRW